MKKYIADQNELKLNYYWDEPKVKFAGWHRLPANDIETMKRAMKSFGTIKTFAESEVEDFKYYEDGIYEDYYKESDEIIDYQSSIDHSISLVGWTEDAWILRNSWGDWWGEDGYMRIDHTSAGVSLGSAILNYLPWSEYGFENIDIDNTSDIVATPKNTDFQRVARGIYKWGNNNSSIKNSATLRLKFQIKMSSLLFMGFICGQGMGVVLKIVAP